MSVNRKHNVFVIHVMRIINYALFRTVMFIQHMFESKSANMRVTYIFVIFQN